MIEDSINKNLDYGNIKYLNEINEIGVDLEGGETKTIENKYVIHRYIIENESETNRDILKKVIE